MSTPRHATQITLPDGRSATIRPLEARDGAALSAFFLGLSEQTRSTYGPHPFDRETAERLCAAIDERKGYRFVALVHEGRPAEEIIGYMILSREINEGDRQRLGDKIGSGPCACLAPVIGDAYQSQGVGTQMARHVMDTARAIGLYQVILMGGVLADNPRARRLYEGLGFRYVGEFWTDKPTPRLNHDMIADLV